MGNKKKTGKKPSGRASDRSRKKPRSSETLDVKQAGVLRKSLLDKEQEILKTEDALLESMRRFRDLFEQSPIGVGIHDPKGELLIVNSSWLNALGLRSFGEMKDTDLFKDFKLDGEGIKELKSGGVVQYELERNFDKSASGSTRQGIAYFLYITSPLFRDKSVIGYMTQVQDVTERRKIAEAQRLGQLGRLISDMAHEVNNPLMIISGRAELALIQGLGAEDLKDTLNIIVDQCFFAKDIIQRLLKYSRVGKVEKKPVDISASIGFVVDILGHHLRLAGITVKKHIARDLPAVNANEKQLQEVFMNMINNSSDAMPGGGTITIRAEKHGDLARIELEDTGEGMSPKVLEHIFEPFFTTKQKGTGLGLAVCHAIIQEHGGDLFYESKVGVGTKGTIILPAWRASDISKTVA